MLLDVKVAKLNTVISLDTEKLPVASVEYALAYGFTQAYNDAHASVQRKNFETDEAFLAAVKAKVDKRHAQIESGNVPGSRAPADPNAAKARALAKSMAEDTELAAAIEALIAKRGAKKKAA